VMTYADLGTVADLLQRERTLPLALTLDLVTQAGVGLTVLHHQGAIHRDIKPANLLLRSDGDGGAQLMVADLGVAKAILHASGLTHVVGTPAYMAPEQAIGLGVDERADVYALAAVAYHLLTGRVAHEGSISELATMERPPPPSELAELPSGVDEIVLQGLAPDPEDRWPTVRAFVNALQALAPSSERTLLVSPPGPRSQSSGTSEAPPPPGNGSRLLLALVCVAVFLACFGGALVVTQQLH
jgi:eukaryotic-like serine/threonine-protein kinase